MLDQLHAPNGSPFACLEQNDFKTLCLAFSIADISLSGVSMTFSAQGWV